MTACVAIPGLSFQSREDGVVQSVAPCILLAAESPTVTLRPSGIFPVGLIPIGTPFPPFPSLAAGVGHKPQPISSMGRIDGTSRDNGRPAGVADAFQVRMHSVEPILSNRCRNLLSHDDRGEGSADEVEEDRPEVAFVFLPFLLTGDGEGLAGAGAGPEGAIIRPASKSSCIGPSTNACEEVALRVSGKVVGSDINNAPFVHVARRDVALCDQVAQPLRGVGVVFRIISFSHLLASLSAAGEHIGLCIGGTVARHYL